MSSYFQRKVAVTDGENTAAFAGPADYGITQMLDDIDGCTGYTEDKAALGTIKSEFYLKIPNNMTLPANIEPNVSRFTTRTQIARFLKANVLSMIAGGIRENAAVFCALLRYHMVHGGFIGSDLKDRAVYINEVKTGVEENDTAHASILNKDLVQFVADSWENIVGVVLHVFRVRGHHFKPEFQDLYDRTWRSTVIEVPAGVTMPSWEEIAKVALHPFGVKALELVVQYAVQGGRLARGLTLRRSAGCAGSAYVTTCAAAVVEMRSAKWWEAFYLKFKTEIDLLFQQADALKAAGMAAHVNARLFNWNLAFERPDESHVVALAPYVMGWIDTLDRGEPITRQQTITKRATGGSAIRAAFSSVIVNEQRTDRGYQNVVAFLGGATAGV